MYQLQRKGGAAQSTALLENHYIHPTKKARCNSSQKLKIFWFPCRIMMKTCLFQMMLIALLTAMSSVYVYPDVNRGSGKYVFSCKGFFNGYNIPVYYYIPKTGDVQCMPVQFVMHGTNRNADSYRDSWISMAEKYDVIILAPEFDKTQFPESFYQRGNVVSSKGTQNSPDHYTYQLIDSVFEDLREMLDLEQNTYNIYGHSAGAQFVHRFALFHHSPYLDRAVAANAGWYTFTDEDVNFPYGIGGLVDIDVEKFYKTDMLYLFGSADTIRDDDLRVTSEADAQGRNRLERGKNFYAYCTADANDNGYELNWKYNIVEGVAHSNSKMASIAAGMLYSEDKPSVINKVDGSYSLNDDDIVFLYKIGEIVYIVQYPDHSIHKIIYTKPVNIVNFP